ncbi:hypothetical protein H1230_26610 [Paenibacillus sp. 19GGS1-52]|uniref:hypothetical protein n=1 Tax=Paenibacillus sp. 19GGS1-52 TaxID=2758563 RepID=UPI001EFC12FD|nr:hypothetical protein [Paenibacillus sp. 19GGS1-52]ULO06536.1 hypothetical protein H1230_26610 [Paenibacillus sp. 19GGS1-52]
MNKTRRLIISIALLGIIYWLFVWLQPQPFEREYSSIIYSTADQSFARSTDIKLKGNKYRKLLGPDIFVGELTADHDLNYKIKLEGGKTPYSGLITAHDATKATRSIGIVTVSFNFDKIWMELDDINRRYKLQEGDGYISSPAKNREEAILISHLIAAGK